MYKTIKQKRIHIIFISKLNPCTSVFSLVVHVEAEYLQLSEVRPNYKPEHQERISDKSKDIFTFESSFYIEKYLMQPLKQHIPKYSGTYSSSLTDTNRLDSTVLPKRQNQQDGP